MPDEFWIMQNATDGAEFLSKVDSEADGRVKMKALLLDGHPGLLTLVGPGMTPVRGELVDGEAVLSTGGGDDDA